MDAIAIVVVDKAANDLIRLLVTLKIMTLITLRLKYGVEGLDGEVAGQGAALQGRRQRRRVLAHDAAGSGGTAGG